jgi:hypothetical protein
VEWLGAKHELLHLLELVVLTIAEAGWAVAFVADDAGVAIFVAGDDELAAATLEGGGLGVLNDHRLTALAEVSELVNAAGLRAGAQGLALPAVEDQTLGQVLDDVRGHGFQLLEVEVLDALVFRELGAGVLPVADLAHYKDVRTFVLDMGLQIDTGHVLELLAVADVAAILGTLELGVVLQLFERLPKNNARAVALEAPVRKLTEIDAVLDDLIHRLEEVTLDAAVRTLAFLEVWARAVQHLLLAAAVPAC